MPAAARSRLCSMFIYIYICIYIDEGNWPSWLGLQNTPTTFLQRGKTPGCDTIQTDGKVPVMLELLGMRSTPLFSSLLGSLLPGEVASDRVLTIGKIERFGHLYCVLMLN